MHLLVLQPVMQSGGMPSGRAFLHLRCKKKTPTRATRPVPERRKCEPAVASNAQREDPHF